MKYPQLVSMPEALRTWLEDELEARGIDAFYSRYILSILQHKSPEENPPQEVRRGRKRGRRDRVDLDRERRLIAVECLVSASDQQLNGIESLIDELCTKLRDIQSEGDNNSREAPGASTTPLADSPRDSFSFLESEKKYTAAFPQLAPSKLNTEGCSFFNTLGNSSVWNGKKILGSSFGRNQSNLILEKKEKTCAAVPSDKWQEENKENQVSKENVGTNEKMRSRSTVKQQISQKAAARRSMAKSLDRKDDMLKVKVSLDGGGKARRLELANDPNLATLLSKFDRGVRAIWSTEKPLDDLDGCDEDLPMDFQQLLDSPDSSSLPFELYKSINNKQNMASSAGGSFIQCGTNITSSIWSENSGGIDVSMDCGSIGEKINNNNNNSECSLTSLSGRSVWDSMDEERGLFRTSVIGERAPKAWSNGENLFPSTPWKLAVSRGNNAERMSQWSDVESTSLKIEDGGRFYTAFGNNILDISLTALNHNKEDSSFREVVPNRLSSANLEKFNNLTKNGSVDAVSAWEQTSDEEDLLTSMRTHFQPIGSKEVREEREPRKVQSAPKYEDGATFQISNSLEKPNFERSESGTLYLDSDKEQKYKEFNDPSVETSGDFVPKFKICQNEKFCQTDEVPKDEEDFYFPGDKNRVEEDMEKDAAAMKQTMITVDSWVATWPASIWSNDTPRSWCDVWSADVTKSEEGKEGDQYAKLKDEIFEEGEELLSNISSIQNLLRSNDEPPSNMQTTESESDFDYKMNTIPLPSKDVWKTNERYLDQTIPLGEPLRQPLLSILARTESAVM